MQLLYICSTNNESNIHKQNGGKNKIDSYDEHVHTIQFQLYDKELFWSINIIKNLFKILES